MCVCHKGLRLLTLFARFVQQKFKTINFAQFSSKPTTTKKKK